MFKRAEAVTRLLIGVCACGIACAGIPCVDAHASDAAAVKKARERYEEGDAFYRDGKYPEAQEEFLKAMELLGRNPDYAIQIVEEEKSTKTRSVTVSPDTDKQGESLVEQQTFTRTTTAQPVYLIGIDDQLTIKVWENADLDQDVTVRPDGMISFSLVGDVQAAGRTIPDLDGELTGRLQEFIKDPQVYITLKKMASKKAVILGEVNKPGVYEIERPCSVLELVGRAEGFTPAAVLSSVILIKGGVQDPHGTRLDLNRFVLKTDNKENVYVNPEDIVFVPKKFIANVNYFVTQVMGPFAQGATNYDTFNEIRTKD